MAENHPQTTVFDPQEGVSMEKVPPQGRGTGPGGPRAGVCHGRPDIEVRSGWTRFRAVTSASRTRGGGSGGGVLGSGPLKNPRQNRNKLRFGFWRGRSGSRKGGFGGPEGGFGVVLGGFGGPKVHERRERFIFWQKKCIFFEAPKMAFFDDFFMIFGLRRWFWGRFGGLRMEKVPPQGV